MLRAFLLIRPELELTASAVSKLIDQGPGLEEERDQRGDSGDRVAAEPWNHLWSNNMAAAVAACMRNPWQSVIRVSKRSSPHIGNAESTPARIQSSTAMTLSP